MNELNLKLQGKDNLVCDLYRIIKGFQRKLSLFEKQLEEKTSLIIIVLKSFVLQLLKVLTSIFLKKIFVI